MDVDVVTEIVIDRPVAEVAAYASDPANAPEWYVNISSVAWQSEPPVQVGSRVEFVPGTRLVMRTDEGPFPMETTYTWAAVDSAATAMTLRNRGRPAGFSKVVAPLMRPAMRRANRTDLARLKAILERHADRPAHG